MKEGTMKKSNDTEMRRKKGNKNKYKMITFMVTKWSRYH